MSKKKSVKLTKKQKEAGVKVADLQAIAAKVCHEVNRVYCKSIGDNSQKSWDEAPDWQKKSAVMGVYNIKENPMITPAQQHSCWMALKQSEGWVYGEEKDEEKKTHPCMQPYDDLPIEQQTKDKLFGTIVRTVLGIG